MPGIGFRAARGGGVTARFAAAEALLLRGLVSQVAELIGEELPQDEGQPRGGGGDVTQGTAAGAQAALEEMLRLSGRSRLPDDPILARLFPDAYPDDQEAAGEFRRYTERGLASGKMAAAHTVLDTLPESGGRVQLSAEQAQAWLRSLNDIRLALGVQLDVTEDMDVMRQRAARGGPQAAGLWIYDWLSVLQETLVHALW